jgi:AhpC/TSA antioxidant enzyme
LRQHAADLDRLGVQVVVVTFQGLFMAQAYARQTQLAWPILVDEALTLYAAYGMERGRWWDIWAPASWWMYAKLLLRGRRLQPSAGDPLQLGGDVLIDRGGIVRLHHIGRGPADRPAVEAILEVVRGHATEAASRFP